MDAMASWFGMVFSEGNHAVKERLVIEGAPLMEILGQKERRGKEAPWIRAIWEMDRLMPMVSSELQLPRDVVSVSRELSCTTEPTDVRLPSWRDVSSGRLDRVSVSSTR